MFWHLVVLVAATRFHNVPCRWRGENVAGAANCRSTIVRGGTHVRATPRGSSTGESGDGRQPGVLVGRLPRLLARSAATAQLLVCDISYWEVATKAARRRLPLAMDAALWLQRAEAAPGVRPVPVTRELLLMSAHLPGELHGDPADRLLIAAAQLFAAPLVTVDERIIAYAKVQGGVPVCDARR